ncbi:protein kinase [Mycobacterium vicinigordonae]|uniref:non-specific serine/threonine protein kinase n=2 Tax=Mycobacterium vicinigordonae TaxID=1719132 RepID=A0A7D6E5J0_9MYCO|nr:protein kinase [Mycobacterium vicinigordonae]
MLGRGGMGEVYRAHDTITERIVAVKVLPADLAGDAAFEQRFRREARTAATINDPHVVPIHNYGEIDGRLYVDMRLIEGRDLGTLIADEGGRLNAARAVAIIEQVASALDSAHQEQLVHRDVKPSNILITGRDFAYLIDFGIARAAADTAMTKTGHMIGTLAYMAPERFNGTTDPGSDVYALACVLYECLTGERPYPGDSLEEQVAGHLTKPPPRPSVRCPDLPQALDAVIARGMAKNPQDRYRTASEFARAARVALTGPVGSAWTTPIAHAPAPHPAIQPAGFPGWPPASEHLRTEPNFGVQPERQQRAELARRRRIQWIAGGAVAAAVAVVAVVTAVAVAVGTDDHSGSTTSRGTSVDSSFASPPPAQFGSATPLPPFRPSSGVGANCQYPATSERAAKEVKPPRTGTVPTDPAQVSVSMVTNQGNIGLMLANNESPCTVNSFISLATQGYFKDTKCHRLTTAKALSVLQCGHPAGNGTGGPGYQFGNEYPTDQYPAQDPKLQQPVVYPRGTLAMANAGPDTNGSQFFLVYRDSALPPNYTVFGTVQADGLATLDRIAAAGVVGGGQDGSPATDVVITSVLPD